MIVVSDSTPIPHPPPILSLPLTPPGGSIIAILSSEAIGYTEKRLADKKISSKK